MGAKDTLIHAWNAFTNVRPDNAAPLNAGPVYSRRPEKPLTRVLHDKTIVPAIYMRIAIDVSTSRLRHSRVDPDTEIYQEDVQSNLNYCFRWEPNIDQTPSHFMRDYVYHLFEWGDIAIVPVRTTINPAVSGAFDVKDMRCARIIEWEPEHVRVDCYNDETGRYEQIRLHKSAVAIVENPFHQVMNERSSMLQQLIKTMQHLDVAAEKQSAGKLDMIIQLPYSTAHEKRRDQAERRRTDMEWQLENSKFGVAYADVNEKITQLNRPIENTLLKQAEWLLAQVYGQLGMTPEVMNGTADEATMLNYENRTIKVVLDALVEALNRTFLSKTARTQGHQITYFRNPFKLVPLKDLAEIFDKLARNEIAASNEMRSWIGLKPSMDPRANELRNSNMPQPDAPADAPVPGQDPAADDDPELSGMFDNIDQELDSLLAGAGASGG